MLQSALLSMATESAYCTILAKRATKISRPAFHTGPARTFILRLCPEPLLNLKIIECIYSAAFGSKPSISLHDSLRGVHVVRGIQFDTIKALGSIYCPDPPRDPVLIARANTQFPSETNNDNHKHKVEVTALHDIRLTGDCI